MIVRLYNVVSMASITPPSIYSTINDHNAYWQNKQNRVSLSELLSVFFWTWSATYLKTMDQHTYLDGQTYVDSPPWVQVFPMTSTVNTTAYKLYTS